ncbi:MAG: biotin--[acetyl-CoA-carboxylase] ligase [Proteobacteria bacterium]|nr:biotin--[acetyl-CoA-carboxylase] ligase [Pseudomonadota bacterium]MBU4259880.1 biotin--[acetyl-CoA-carboxylase] ligase [Pseudomonadota bacterium]MBU4286897.1 biotin--[acetyl-CoA-carboxylase] ligase [Pseudomonadota bacterium]MBU4413985.1 biotin--[acetyl-CoA-carboxylase] ligase [Pseudomonadota bacterium]MCG2758585.1 biotin--[acetyl-CoA-carboxylase] ligase [Desulfobacteraceae bacterium]
MATTKDKLLLFLKKNQGSWVSGELISNNLSVSRAAIWKHIQKLKEEGYVIESASKKGYLLSESSDPITADEIRQGLSTKVFGKKNIIYLNETDSTNTRAKELAAQGAPEGTLVIAEKQTNGRGRRGRSWFSPPGGGIYFSLILRPVISPTETPRITLMTAVVAAETLISLVKLKLRIKWPNDILVNGKKLAGILTEISTEMDAVNYIIVGLGLNVNTRFEKFPQEIKENATSILIETGKQFPRVKLIQHYLKLYEIFYDMFKNNDFEPIMNRWRELADIIGKQIKVDVIGKTHIGKVIDVDNDGVLILKDDQGRLQRIFSGDVTLARQLNLN